MSVVEVRGLTVRFGPVEVVTDVDLDLRAGVVTGLIGPNGAGKTTVIDALTGFVPVASGSITLDGRAIGRLPAHRRARLGLGRTFQSLELFEDLTVAENCLVAAEAAGGGAAWADEMGGTGAGKGTAVDLLPSHLSNAQRRLVALTRAVAGRPTVLLLDEPAAGLDPAGRLALGRRLRRLAADGAAVLLVDHDLDLVLDVCDEVTVLDRGRVIATGPPAALRSDPRVRAAYLGTERDDAATASVAPPTPATATATAGPPVLEVRGLAAGYGATEVVHDVDLTVGGGEIVALLGLNGAGKTTTVLAVAGALPRARGEVRLDDAALPSGRPHVAARRGLACVPQERSLFTQLSVAENLRLAVGGGRATVAAETARAVEYFPALADILDRRAGLLSGGEQRMVALARALARHPQVLLVDEMSLGLGPRVVDDLGRVLRQVVADERTAVLLVEQHLDVALALATRAYVMDRGRVVAEGPSAEIAADPGPLTI